MTSDAEFTGDDARMRQTGWPRLRGKLFHLLFLIRRPMTLGARGIVLDAERNMVFLIRHTYVPGWQLPGGGVEHGETMLEAVTREVREEGNIEITAPPRLLSVHLNSHVSKRDHVGIFLITSFRQTAPFAPDHEIAETGFFPVDALPEETTAGTRRRIAEAVSGRPASPYW